jgi:putative hydrolase of the HAD superfamily
MEKPTVIFFDAVGTLFGVRGSVGEVYRSLALEFGIKVDTITLEHAFRDSFQAASPPVFPGVEPEKIPQQEFAWWKAIATSTFAKVGKLEQFADFECFFDRLYAHFATQKPWFVYPDVVPTLQNWQQQGVELGIISNFDTRLYPVLKQLDLEQFFTSITISSLVGAAKPAREIFGAALAKHGCPPEQAWHIGDSLTQDYRGAKQVGIKSFWLNRFQPVGIAENQLPNLSSLR